MPKAVSSNVDGPEYVRRLALARESVVDAHANTPSDAEDDIDDEDSQFTTKTIDSGNLHDIYGNAAGRPDDDDLSFSSNEATEDAPLDGDLAIDDGPGDIAEGGGDNGPSGAPSATTTGGGALQGIPRGRSKAHHLLEGNKLVFFSLDLETGRENCGIIQLSVEIIRGEIKRGGKTAVKDTFSTIQRGEGVFHEEKFSSRTLFNAYFKPQEDMRSNDKWPDCVLLPRQNEKFKKYKPWYFCSCSY